MVIFGLIGALLISFIGVSVDFGRAIRVQTRMQASLDAAVLAGAALPSASQKTVAASMFAANLDTPDAGPVSPNFTASSNNAFTGTATANVPTTFAGIMGVKKLTVSVASTAMRATASSQSTTGKACILVLDTSDTQTFLINSGADVRAPDCEVHVKSTANPAAIFNAGTTIDTSRICIAGANIIDNGGTHPNLQKSCASVSDPFAGTLPTPITSGCDVSNANYDGGTVNLTPGVYCGWINFNNAPTVNFAPGVYVIKNGGWNVNGGTWSGTGVTFYYADQSKIQFNSAVHATLTAPTSGTYAGLMIYEPNGLGRSPFVLDDSRGFNVSGLIYLPSRDVTFNSGSQLTNKSLTLVTYTLILNGTLWNLSSATPDIPITTTTTSGGTWVLSQ